MRKSRLYFCPINISHIDSKTGKKISCPDGYPSDGATHAIDIYSNAWFLHDIMCDRGTWNDGTPCTQRDASRVLKDVLKSEGHCARARYWGLATFLFTKLPCSNFGGLGQKRTYPEFRGRIFYGYVVFGPCGEVRSYKRKDLARLRLELNKSIMMGWTNDM